MVFFRRGLFITAVLFLSSDAISALADTKLMTSNTRARALGRDNASRNLRDAYSKEKEERAPLSGIRGHITESSSKKEIDSLHQALIKPHFDAKNLDTIVVKSSTSFEQFFKKAYLLESKMEGKQAFDVLKSILPGKGEVAHMLDRGLNSWTHDGIAKRLEEAQFQSWKGMGKHERQPGVVSKHILGVDIAHLKEPGNEWANDVMKRYADFLYPKETNSFSF